METKSIPLTKKEYLWLLEKRLYKKDKSKMLIFLGLFVSLFWFTIAVAAEGERGFFVGILFGTLLLLV